MDIRRREVIGLLGSTAAALGLPSVATAQNANSAHRFSFERPGGGRFALSNYRDRPLLVVNTATNCGFAGQFATLEQVWQRYRERGLMLIAVPSNDFGGQEPLDGAAIAEAARATHGATYAFAEKSVVRGAQAHPFYRWAAELKPAETPRWNFHKYLIGRDGSLRGGFGATTDPLSPQLVKAIGEEFA